MKRPTGRPPIPTALNRLRGFPGHQARNRREPEPLPASADCPKSIADDAIARETWDELAPELIRLNLLTTIDRPVLASACRWWAVYRRADATLGGDAVYISRNNGRQALPEVLIALRAWKAATDVFDRFGVTPSSRTRLAPPAPHVHEDSSETLLRKFETARRPA